MVYEMPIKITSVEQLRKAKEIKYKDMDSNISRGTYRDIISGRIPASDESVKKMTQIFNVGETEIRGLLKNNI